MLALIGAGFADVWNADVVAIYVSLAPFVYPGHGQESRFCRYLRE